MEKLASALLSMRSMAVALFLFFVAIAAATFIESHETTQAAKLWVYNAKWFEILLAFLGINLVANIFRYEMWKREKIAMFLFHISFLVIMIGAWVTRYISYEGRMMIREGASSNIIYSADPYLWVNVNDNKLQYTNDLKTFMAESFWNNDADMDIEFPNHKTPIRIEYVDFKSKHIDTIQIDKKFNTEALEIVTDGMKSNYILNNEIFNVGGVAVAFSKQEVTGINIYKKNDTLRIKPSMPLKYVPMKEMQRARQTGTAPPDSVFVHLKPYEEAVFLTTTLYQIAGQQFVFKQAIPNVGRKLVPSGSKERGADYLIVKVTDGKESKIIQLEGGINMIGKPVFFSMNGLNYHLEYGSKRIFTPFYVKCLDFKLDRYPGSDMPSSFASDLQILDTANKEFGRKHVFMNHVLDYRGYRFFQSNYDPDEQGTILSVNHDFWGTNITYLGYLMMTIGMVFNIFSRNSRFREILTNLSKSKNKAIGLFIAALTAFGAQAQTEHVHEHNHEHEAHAATPAPQKPKTPPVVFFITPEHSKELATLLVQDMKGRYIPMHTMCTQVLSKMHRATSYDDHDAVQVVISMHMYPEYWVDQKIIQVPSAVKSAYKLESYVSLKELMDDQGNFIYLKEYNEALQRPETRQSETQKKLIKLGEKFQVFLQVVNWQFMKLVPLKGDANHRWFSPFAPELLQVDSVGSKLTLNYISSLNENGKTGGNFSNSLALLNQLKAFQRQNGKDLPSETAIKVEVSYNKMGIFKNSMRSYLLLGLVVMALFFMELLGRQTDKRIKNIGLARKIFTALILVIFVYHGAGLGMRSYITGQAPWSDGYEAIVYIAWVAMLAGLLFSTKHRVIIPAASIIASILLMVTELNLLDPEITPLVPVLKSYWLMIHVAVITSSYAFLAISFILGAVNMVLYIVRKPHNGEKLTRNINEITYVSEMSMTIGLFMLAIGTFLGGIWANESWGRYWGWDPKETWALASVLVYSIVMHFRYIPGLKSKFALNVASIWAFSAIVFTFLGVNFILVGLHSYANGDGSVAFPPSVWITVALFLSLCIVARRANKKYEAQVRAKL